MNVTLRRSQRITTDDVILFIYFAIMYAHNLPFPRLFTLSTFALAAYAFAKTFMARKFSIGRNQYSVLFWYLSFIAYEFIISQINDIYVRGYWSNVLQNTLLFFSLCTLVDNKYKFYKLLKTYAYATLYFGLVVWLTSPYSTWGTLQFQGITLTQRNTTAYVVGIGYLFFLYFALKEGKKHFYLFAGINAIVVILTGSRKGLIQLVIPILLYIVLQKNVRRKIKTFGSVLLVGLIVAIILANSTVFMDTYSDRFLEMFSDDTEDTSVLSRNALAELGMEMFREKPVFGHGLGASEYRTERIGLSVYFHNNYIELLTAGGIVGMIIYNIPFIKTALSAWRRRKRSNYAKLLICGIVIYYALGVGQVTMYYATFYAALFFILVGGKYINSYE